LLSLPLPLLLLLLLLLFVLSISNEASEASRHGLNPSRTKAAVSRPQSDSSSAAKEDAWLKKSTPRHRLAWGPNGLRLSFNTVKLER
jgi:hypothetical protein